MGNPTTEIRAKLDELGVEWWPSDDPQCEDIITHWRVEPLQWTAIEGEKGLWLNAGIAEHEPLTPEQAIAATVGGSDVSALRAKVKAQSDYIGKLRGEYKALDEQMERRCAEYRDTIRKLKAELDAATVDRLDTMGLWPEWEQVLFANVSDEVAQDNLNECVHELLDKAATVGAGTCIYTPDETGFTWWDENDVEHYEEHSASDECCSASCDKCGNQMMVGDDGWFNGWDEITEWWEEDGSYHKGYVLEPRFKYCPNCGRRIEGEAE